MSASPRVSLLFAWLPLCQDQGRIKAGADGDVAPGPALLSTSDIRDANGIFAYKGRFQMVPMIFNLN